MNKKFIYTSIAATSALAIIPMVASIYTAEATTVALDQTSSSSLLAATDTTVNTPKIPNTKDETVYIMSDAAGNFGTTFIGSTIYRGSSEIPFTMDIQYFLDGTEISPNELVGKSGHTKIVFKPTSTFTQFGKKVPFLAITSINLDASKFTNLSITNGKIIQNGDTISIVGYTMPGINEDFGTTIAPDVFVIEADVKDFSLDNSYTLITNSIFSDIDTSRLSDLDDIVSSINQLSSGLDKIIAGSASLSNGAAEALSGTRELRSGYKELANGLQSASTGATELSNGLNYLTTNYNQALTDGANSIIESTLAEVNTSLTAMATANSAMAAGLTQLGVSLPLTTSSYADSITTINNALGENPDLTRAKNLLDFAIGVSGYTSAVSDATTGASKLASGLNTMAQKTPLITSGLDTLVNGLDALYGGSVSLQDGLNTFKTTGIDRLTAVANNDLAGFTRNARTTVSASSSYHYFDNSSAESVKFIIKTPSIK